MGPGPAIGGGRGQVRPRHPLAVRILGAATTTLTWRRWRRRKVKHIQQSTRAFTKTTTKTPAREGGEGDVLPSFDQGLLNISPKGVCSTDASEFDCCVTDCSPPRGRGSATTKTTTKTLGGAMGGAARGPHQRAFSGSGCGQDHDDRAAISDAWRIPPPRAGTCSIGSMPNSGTRWRGWCLPP